MEWNDLSALRTATETLIRKKAIAVEHLTQKQLVDAMAQAVACGDFQRLVVEGTAAQQVVYVPFAEYERLKGENDAMLAAIKDAIQRSNGQDPAIIILQNYIRGLLT